MVTIVFLLASACTPVNIMETQGQHAEPVTAVQARAIDVRPFLSESELMRSVSVETWVTLGLGEGNDSGSVNTNPVKGIVAPHHAAAAALSAECISKLVENEPPCIIILAPNHYNTGSPAISTTGSFTCYGRSIPTDQEAIKRLYSMGLVSISDVTFEKEHSVGMLVPIIAWYLPEAKVIPVIFHHGFSVQGILDIIDALRPEIDEGAAIVASIDFSHYLTMSQAEEKDREMRGYLLNGEAGVISGLDSGYIDSPTIMAAMLSYFGTENMEIIANTNSGRLMQNPISPCTSYFTIQFQ